MSHGSVSVDALIGSSMSLPRLHPWIPGSLLVSLCLAGAGLAAKPAPSAAPLPAAVDFARDIQPLLRSKCFACHGGGQGQGGLRLDTRAEALRGGDSGVVIKPGHAAESLLIQRVSGVDPKRVMPPAGPRLTPAEVQRLRRWIDAGAAWSEGTGPADGARSRHWAFQPIVRPAVPQVRTPRAVIRNPIDAFVLARLEKEGLRPSPEADPVTLIRRLSLDLLGLPPTPEEVDAFVREYQQEASSVKRQALSVKPQVLSTKKGQASANREPQLEAQRSRPDAYLRLVDRLLASPHFGERWGRHWLDLARYADSDGYEKDLPRPYAYLYRDWVIHALNADLPFDEFTVEQLAGDLLVQEELGKSGNAGNGKTSSEKAGLHSAISSLTHLPPVLQSKLIATGFHRNTLKNREGGVDQEEDRVKATLDRANTTGTVWLGLTVGCAQCHSHKYDPITQREYYGLFAFFNTVREVDLPYPAPGEPAAGKKGAAGRTAAVILENPKPPTTHLLVRGDFLRPGEVIRPHSLAVLPALKPQAEQPTRLDLARWLVSPENPLTARVAVNRIWGHLFGQGLVATPDDFGVRGAKPSHPELLDWLAAWFRGEERAERDEGKAAALSPLPSSLSTSARPWSQKALIRLIVTSATYRQSSRSRPELEARDPKNVLLARQSRFRPEAEIVRDLYLAASGLLTPAVGGPSIRPPLPGDIAALGYAGSIKWPETTGPDRYRRGMYVFFQRTVPYPQLVQFDAPDGNATCTRRERSNTPLQALTLLNDPVFVECARALGQRLAQEPAASPEARVRLAFRRCVSREPTPAEAARLQRLYAEILPVYKTNSAAAVKLAGTELPAGVDPAEAAAWTVVARTVLNLDEFITRE